MRAAALAIAVLLAAVPAAADSVQLESLDGAPVELAPAADGSRVLHFWATWCPSCKAELGALDRAARACDGSRVEVVAVNVGEDAETVREYLAAHPLSSRVLRDPKGKAWRSGGGREMPANWIWSSERRSWSFGPSSEAQWSERLAALGCATGPGYLE